MNTLSTPYQHVIFIIHPISPPPPQAEGPTPLMQATREDTRDIRMLTLRARRTRRLVAPDRSTPAMGACLSMCESTPDVPANIIADPEVRLARARVLESTN
ncbi:hypothetical protein BE221DRAFT_190610 [Ostreococcus tauri]|uniref:Uncharacterized protein n=1 Tax=Ostreococcus tauri TaxID=70448 RepID=A0A1Y5IDJ5_OSTTA|nr:hypothetical protein BE221DRAFT_190610 [Ostreococcus tauri]